LHHNRQDYGDVDYYLGVMDTLANTGCSYYCENVVKGECEDCGTIMKKIQKTCPKCSSDNISGIVRVIGYLAKIPNYNKARREEAMKRVYSK